MPYYLPLCASRQSLLPPVCRSCAWWQTTGSAPRDPKTAGDMRRQWMTSVEATWGSPGLLLAFDSSERGVPSGGAATTRAAAPGANPKGAAAPATVPAPSGRTVTASINYAPAAAVPRFRELPFAPLPTGAVLLFCLKAAGDPGHTPAKRLLHKALDQLRQRGVHEVYAVAVDTPGVDQNGRCEFFSLGFAEANGFVRVRDDGRRYLVRADLRSLLSVISQLQATVRRVLHIDPTPTPATWTRRDS